MFCHDVSRGGHIGARSWHCMCTSLAAANSCHYRAKSVTKYTYQSMFSAYHRLKGYLSFNPFALRVPPESIVCYSHTFENNFGMKEKFEKYLKESCCLVFDEDFSCKYFPKNALVWKILSKLSGLFWVKECNRHPQARVNPLWPQYTDILTHSFLQRPKMPD